MSDTDLRDDMVKLVSYSIVCIERGRERALVCNECRVFSENLDDCDFDTWVVAEYIDEWQCSHQGRRFPCNKKDLRVVHTVLGRWPKQDLHYEEKQLRRLAGIEEGVDRIADEIGGRSHHHHLSSGSGTGTGGSGTGYGTGGTGGGTGGGYGTGSGHDEPEGA